MKNHKTIIALLLSILLVGGLIIWDSRKTQSEEVAKQKEKMLFNFRSEDIMRIEILNSIGHQNLEITLGRSSDGWKILKPIDAEADQTAVSQLIDAIAGMRYTQPIADSREQWPRYELEPPQIKVGLLDSKGKTHSVYVGTKAQTGYDVYIGIPTTHKVYTVSYSVQQALNKNVFHLRRKQLQPVASGDLKELTYRSPEPFTAKFAMSHNQFELTSPERLATSRSDVMSFLTDLNSLTALEIKDEPGASFDKAFRNSIAQYEVAWTLADNSSHRVVFSVFNSELWATDNGGKTYLKFDRERDLRKIRKTLTDFRDKKIFSFHEEDVVGVTIDGKKSPDVSGNAKLLIGDLNDLRAEDFMDSAPAGADIAKPDHTVQVDLKGNKKIDLKVWKVGDNVYVKSNSSKTIYKTNPMILNSLRF